MGTYDTRGGHPISPNDPMPDPSPLVESILGILEDADVPTEINDQIVKLIEQWEAETAAEAIEAEWFSTHCQQCSQEVARDSHKDSHWMCPACAATHVRRKAEVDQEIPY